MRSYHLDAVVALADFLLRLHMRGATLADPLLHLHTCRILRQQIFSGQKCACNSTCRCFVRTLISPLVLCYLDQGGFWIGQGFSRVILKNFGVWSLKRLKWENMGKYEKTWEKQRFWETLRNKFILNKKLNRTRLHHPEVLLYLILNPRYHSYMSYPHVVFKP